MGQFHWKKEVHVWQSTHGNRGWHSPRRNKIWFRESATFSIVTNEYKWNSSTNKTVTSKGQTGKQVFETQKDCEELQGFPIRKDSNWTNKGHLNLAHEVLKGFSPVVSRQFSKTVARSNIERVLNKITILLYKEKKLMILLYKDKFTTNILRQLHYYKILYFIPLAV